MSALCYVISTLGDACVRVRAMYVAAVARALQLDVSELLRETAGVTNRRATELIQLDAGNLTVYNTQEFEPHSIA